MLAAEAAGVHNLDPLANGNHAYRVVDAWGLAELRSARVCRALGPPPGVTQAHPSFWARNTSCCRNFHVRLRPAPAGLQDSR